MAVYSPFRAPMSVEQRFDQLLVRFDRLSTVVAALHADNVNNRQDLNLNEARMLYAELDRSIVQAVETWQAMAALEEMNPMLRLPVPPLGDLLDELAYRRN